MSRSVAVLLGHLVLGCAAVGTAATTGALLVGCDDDSQPDYWVKKLNDPGSRAGAIKRLTQFYEDGLTKNNNNKDTPEMKALLAKIVGPMAEQYVKGDLDEKTRIELLKSLANTRDPAAKDAILKAIKDFAAGKASAEEMTQAALYVKQLKLKEASKPMLDAFLKIQPSDKTLGPPYKAVADAMRVIPDPDWEPKLLELINRPMDAKDSPAKMNETYWQTVSAELLGELKSTKAVRPLFKIALMPEKANVAATAVVALIKIGKPSVPPVLDVLSGKDAEMNEIAKKNGDATAAVKTAAIVLGTIGRPEAVGPMIVAMNSAQDDPTKAVIGREMSKLPTSKEAIGALETAFEKVGISAVIPPGDSAKIVIAEAAGTFMDSSIVPWLLKQITVLKTAKGEKEEIDNIQVTLLQTAMKLMKKDQVDDVKKSLDAEGGDLDKAAFKRASEVLTACGDNVGCYLGKLEDPAVQQKNEQFTGIKAAYMLAMLGNDATKAEIVKRLPKITNAAIRFVAISAIDHLSPTGDNKTADDLQQIIDADAARGDQNAIQGDAPIKQIIPRLRARTS